MRVNSAMSGSMKIHHSNRGHEPSSEVDMSGRRVPTVDTTRDDDDTRSHVSGIPLQLPATAHVSSNNSAWVKFSQAGGDLVQTFAVSSQHQIRRGQVHGNDSVP